MDAEEIIVLNHKGWRVKFNGWQSWRLRTREDAIKLALGLVKGRDSLRVLVLADDGQVLKIPGDRSPI
jgi:hypothetical protein